MMLAAIVLAAGFSLPASAQVRGVGGQERDGTQKTQRTGGISGAQRGDAQSGDKKDAEKQDVGETTGGQQRGGVQGGRGRQEETPPVPAPERPAADGKERPVQERPNAGTQERPVQREGAGAQERPNAGTQERPVQERPNAGTQERPNAGTQERPGRGQGTGEPGNGKGQGAERSAAAKTLTREQKGELMRQMTAEMNMHRENEAKIKRLTLLARESKDADTVARVTALAAKETKRHQSVLDRIEASAGVENFRIAMQRLEGAAGGGAERGNAGGRPAPERGNVGDKPAPERGNVGDKPAPARGNAGDKPVGERGQGNAGGAGSGRGNGGGNGGGAEKRGGGR